jgi:hypothetical protein
MAKAFCVASASSSSSPRLAKTRLAACGLHQLPPGTPGLVQGLQLVDRNADGAHLGFHGAADALPHPPGSIGRELESTLRIKLLHRPHQADVPFLDQVAQGHASISVLLGDGDDQAQVGSDEVRLGQFGHGPSLLDLAGQRYLILGGEQRNVPHTAQVALEKRTGIIFRRGFLTKCNSHG